MSDRTLAALFVLALWWLSTGIVLRLVWLGRSPVRVSVVGALAAFGLYGLHASSRIDSAYAAYVAFVSALTLWGFHELLFLLGLVTGPRKTALPSEARGWARFRYATEAVIHHEVALALTMLLVAMLTWRAPNQVGTQTFLVLWVMRLSAKMNVFLGVRNLSEQFVPNHLRYMLSYFRRARMNWLMPFSIALPSAVVLRLTQDAWADGAPQFTVVARVLVLTLLALAVPEHVFLTLPVPDALLWRWATRIHSKSDAFKGGSSGQPARSTPPREGVFGAPR